MMRRGPAVAGSDADVSEGPPGTATAEAVPKPPAPPLVVERADELRTEFDFVLPRGYLDPSGSLQRDGTMRLATARDELLPLHDDRVRANPPYLTVVLLARVITRLGSLSGDAVNVNVVENLFASDLAFLQDLYRRVNSEGHTLAAVTCPACSERFSVDLAGGRLGES